MNCSLCFKTAKMISKLLLVIHLQLDKIEQIESYHKRQSISKIILAQCSMNPSCLNSSLVF